MRRREFITLLGGAAIAWPLPARAQQPARMRRVGVLMGTAADDPEGTLRLAAFLQALQEFGWTIGRNMHLAASWARCRAPRRRSGWSCAQSTFAMPAKSSASSLNSRAARLAA